jgi:predicted acylesterase/phospholipase RssA
MDFEVNVPHLILTVFCLFIVIFCLLGSRTVFRWPLLGLLLSLAFAEFVVYMSLRYLIYLAELFRPFFRSHRELRENVRRGSSLQTLSQWRECALQLDKVDGRQSWKHRPESHMYDYTFVQSLLRDLQIAKERGDLVSLQQILHTCVQPNVAGILNPNLYSYTNTGTKLLIEKFVEAVSDAIAFLQHSPVLSALEKQSLALKLQSKFGQTALLLSGGGANGNYHYGVVAELLDAGLLPQIISGTSAGSLVAAHVCVRTDDELRTSLTPAELEPHMAFDQGLSRLQQLYNACSKRFVFESDKWIPLLKWHTMGDTTFREAFLRSGRSLCIPACPAHPGSPVLLFSHVSTPNVVIWSAALASSNIPGLLDKPVQLLEKDAHGQLRPFYGQGGTSYFDGSMRSDLPLGQVADALFSSCMYVCTFAGGAYFQCIFLHRQPGQSPCGSVFLLSSRRRWAYGQ